MDFVIGNKQALLLSLLIANGEQNGRQLVRASDGMISNSSVYNYLFRLEERGFIESRTVDAEKGGRGPRRRVYKVTGAGISACTEWAQQQRSILGISGV